MMYVRRVLLAAVAAIAAVALVAVGLAVADTYVLRRQLGVSGAVSNALALPACLLGVAASTSCEASAGSWVYAVQQGGSGAALGLAPTTVTVNQSGASPACSAPLSFANLGSAASGAVSVSVTGDYTASGCTNSCLGTTLSAGATCVVAVKGTASTEKALTGQIQVQASGAGTVTVPLSGQSTGFAPPSLICPSGSSAYRDGCSWTSTGVFQFTVPSGVTTLHAEVVGASGGTGSLAGRGYRIVGATTVTPGETLSIKVGASESQGAFGSNGATGATLGGDLSFVRLGNNTYAVIAGGGGGGANNVSGGDAGLTSGQAGTNASDSSCHTAGGGGGGTQSAGGAGGINGCGNTYANGSPGTSLAGGNAGNNSNAYGGGTGGAGYFGGGGGSGDTGGSQGGGGGGGSSFVGGGVSVSTHNVYATRGNGFVRLTLTP